MRIINLDEASFDEFSSKHRYRNIYQTSSYGRLMKKNGYDVDYLGFQNNRGELIGASLLLYKQAILNYKYAYVPRGFLIDYTDQDLVMELTDKLRKFLYQSHFILLKIEPPVLCSERKKDGTVISYHPEIDGMLNILKKCGYQHTGFNSFFENTRPRWNALLKLHASNDKLFQAFSKQVRNKIRKADKLGVSVYKVSIADLPIFYEFIKKKDDKSLRYYQELMEEYGDNAEIYLAKIDSFKYVQKTKDAYEKIEEENEYLATIIQERSKRGKDLQNIINRKMESDKILGMEQANLNRSTRLFQTNPEGIIIGGALIVKQDNEVNLIVDGFDMKYANFNSIYYLRWELIQKFNKEHYEYFNLNAIVGDFENKNPYSGLNESKFGLGAVGIEYMGELLYIINPPIYQLYLKNGRKN